MRVAVPDHVTPFSGIGVIQNELYPRLAAKGLDVLPYLSRQPRSVRSLDHVSAVLKALATPMPREADALLALMSPLPLRLPIPTVAMAYDLRWTRTRSALGRIYRGWDITRTVRSDVVVTISHRSADDIRERFPDADPLVIYPGPGQFDSSGVPEQPSANQDASRDVLLIGAARHKRNEVAAQVVALLGHDWVGKVRCINVSSETQSLLTSTLGAGRCEFHVNVSRVELAQLYGACGISIQLGVEEGFGLPYIEALSAGCVVIAVDQPLTRELLGRAAVLVEEGAPQYIARQILELAPPSREDRVRQAARYSWDSFADGIAGALETAIRSRA